MLNHDQKLNSLLLRAGLKPDEVTLYMHVLDNPGCSISDAYKISGISKSSAYRAFEGLRELELLDSSSESWKTNLQPVSLSGLIKKLENKQRRENRLLADLKILNGASKLSGNSKIAGIETLEGDEVFEKYIELSQRDFDTDLVYGNWEAFNNQKSLVSIEKNFIQNRVKNGGRCILVLTGDGPNTKEITDYDFEEDRITKYRRPDYDKKPIWVNAFEGNNLVYIWGQDSIGNTSGTLIDSKPVSEFYKEFIYSQTV